VLASGAKSPRGIAVSGAHVYWTESGTTDDDGQVLSALTTGGAPLAIARAQHRPYRVSIAGGRVFWTNRVAAGTVQSAPLRCRAQRLRRAAPRAQAVHLARAAHDPEMTGDSRASEAPSVRRERAVDASSRDKRPDRARHANR